MQLSHILLLRATACAACLLVGGAAFAQGAGSTQAASVGGMKMGAFTPVVFHTHAARGVGAAGNVGGGRAFNAGRMNGNVGAHAGNAANIRSFNNAGNWHGRGGRGGYGGGYGGWGPGYAYGYPYDYGYDSDDSGYAYDGYDNGYAYDNGYGPDVYAQGEPGAYCQTPDTSCALDHPSVAGAPCQCRSGFDEEPGSAQP
jgi:hypothetical protein